MLSCVFPFGFNACHHSFRYFCFCYLLFNNLFVYLLLQAIAIEIHPLYLILPAGLACSMAFHLPVSTPPNALVAGYANIRTKDMVSLRKNHY